MTNEKAIFKGHSNPDSVYTQRRKQLSEYLKKQGLGSIVFYDSEGHRESAIRYLAGLPSDAVLVLNADGTCVLVPWDIHLADILADADYIIPYTQYDRDLVQAVCGAHEILSIPHESRIEIPPDTPYLRFLELVGEMSTYHVLCRKHGAHEQVLKMRSIKDEYEIECLRKAAQITDEIILILEEHIRRGKIQTEIDAALLIERECRIRGCDHTGFDSLVAGADRSFAIHCFPSYTAGAYPGNGLAILDFGVVYHGYTSDVTITFVQADISAKAEQQITLVEKAYNTALELYKPDIPLCKPAQAVHDIFAAKETQMPHSLGHGIGLEVHEYPVIRPSISEDEVFKPGMVVTLEPGLYSPETGGCRYENDILITETGNEVLTHSRIIRI